MRPSQKNNVRAGGFTLLELLISMVIAVVIVLIMFSSLRMGLNVWDKGEKDSHLLFRLQTVRTLVKNQVASICTGTLFGKGKSSSSNTFFLRGDETCVQFVSRYSILAGNQLRLVYVRYYLAKGEHGDNLMLIEKPFCLASDYENFMALGIEIGNEQANVLIEDIQALRFVYLNYSEEGELQEHSSWGDENNPQKSFPDAVRIVFQTGDIASDMKVRLMSK